MNSKFKTDFDALKSTDWKKPEINFKSPMTLVLLGLLLTMAAVVFIPWFCVGVKTDINGVEGAIKLRAFGFSTWYGIIGLLAALVAVAGVIYKHMPVTFWSSAVAVVMSIIALNSYPESKLVVSVDKDTKKDLKEMWVEVYDREVDVDDPKSIATGYVLGKYPKFKVPGSVVEIVCAADQRMVKKIIKDSDIDLKDEGVKVMKHRLGALLFLFLSIGASVISYIVIGGTCPCACRKETEPAATEEPKEENIQE